MTAEDKQKLDAQPDAGDIVLPSDIGDGAINIEGGSGIEATGDNATANQATGTTRTLSVKTGDGITIDGNGNVIIDPNFNLDGNVNLPDVNDGKLTISDADGNVLGEFTANQAGDTPIQLPAGFSGDYDDLTNKPDIGDGKITIVDADGDPVGEFTVNQAGNTEIILPEIPVPEDQIHVGDTYPGTPSLGDLWVDTSDAPLSCRSGTTAMAPKNGSRLAANLSMRLTSLPSLLMMALLLPTPLVIS